MTHFDTTPHGHSAATPPGPGSSSATKALDRVVVVSPPGPGSSSATKALDRERVCLGDKASARGVGTAQSNHCVHATRRRVAHNQTAHRLDILVSTGATNGGSSGRAGWEGLTLPSKAQCHRQLIRCPNDPTTREPGRGVVDRSPPKGLAQPPFAKCAANPRFRIIRKSS